MADNEEDQTLTATTGTEEQDKSTTENEEVDSKDAPAEDAPAAGDESSEGEEEDESSDDSDDEGDDSAAKERNRSGYLIRQLSGQNPNIRALREQLQPWADDESVDASTRKDRQRDVNDYVKDAASAQDQIARDQEQVTGEIPQFDPRSPQFDRVKTERAWAQFARDHAIFDQNGAKDLNGNPIIVGTRMRLIDFMREKAEDYGFGESTSTSSRGKQPEKKPAKNSTAGKSKNKANAEMDAAADTVGGASNSGGKGNEEEDPFLKGFDNPYESTHANGGQKPNNAHAWSR